MLAAGAAKARAIAAVTLPDVRDVDGRRTALARASGRAS